MALTIDAQFSTGIKQGLFKDIILFEKVLALCEIYGVDETQLRKYIAEAKANGLSSEKYLEGLLDTMTH